MTQAQTTKLDSENRIPEMEFQLLDGSRPKLPDAWARRWGVVLISRGHC